MKTKLLILFTSFLSFTSFAGNPSTDSIFFKSFNLRYSNPNEGIRIAKGLIKDDPQKAYLSLAYNYFFLSNYDSANKYVERAINCKINENLIRSLGHSYKGWVAQRLGRYFEAYQYFDTAKIFFDSNKNDRKYKNDPLFFQGLIINSLGKITLQYYYVNDFSKMNINLNKLNVFVKNSKIEVPTVLLSHIEYLFVQNYVKNLKAINDSIGFKEHIKQYFSAVDKDSYYNIGNLFEVLGLAFIKGENRKYFIDSILPLINENWLSPIIRDIINNSASASYDFLHQSLNYFQKHGDPYQIAGSYFHIATFYADTISKSLERKSEYDICFFDSLYKYDSLSIKVYEERYSEYFKQVRNFKNKAFFKDSVDLFIKKLISFPWYIEALKLKHLIDGLDETNKIRKESFNTFMFLELEKANKMNESRFYFQLEDELKKKIALEKERNDSYKVIAIIVIISIFIFGIMVFLYRRKQRRLKAEADYQTLQTEISAKIEIQQSKTRLEKWNEIINEVFNIREQLLQEDIKPVIRAFKTLNKLLREHFDAEYCAIGVPDKGDLKDIAFNFDHELSAEQETKIRSLSKLPNDKTIIGKFLASEKDFIIYNKNDIRRISNSYLHSYETILNSRNIENIAIFGLYGEKIAQQVKPIIGYISFINVRYEDNEFNKKLNQLISQIKVIFESEDERIRYKNHLKDEKFVNSLIDSELPITEIINKSISYFSKEFKAGIISFRVPVINGPDENPDENLKLVLRDLFVDASMPNHEGIAQYYWDERKTLSLNQVTYRNVMLSNFLEDIYFDEIGQDSNFYTRFEINKVFISKTNIIFPIRKALLQNDLNEEMSTYWRNIYGIYNLQLYESIDIEQIKGRLKFLSMNISYVINSIISKKKYSQIALLHNEISKLDFEELMPFYDQIAYMVNTVINADICSIFIYNKYNNRLELKSTTAKRAIYQNKHINIRDFEFIEDIFYDMNETDSITLKAYKDNKTYMIYSVSLYKNTSVKFIELTQNGDIKQSEKFSRLMVPLKSFDNPSECFGVIRCLGDRNRDQNLIHSFWDFDRETVEFISALAARFIVNAQLSFEKDNFIKQVVHETLSPITEMMHRQVEYYNRLERLNRLPLGFESHHRGLLNNVMLQKQILSDLSDVSMNKTDLMNINPTMENTKKILTDIINFFKDSAFDEKKIAIIPNISELPNLIIDRSKLQQVFINLLKNAINYSNKETKISIIYKLTNKFEEGFSNNTWHEIKFVNNGIGIPANETKDIFLLYRRGSNASKLKPSGSGIGLFLVDKIIKAHGGFCKVMNLNNPTEISIFLPAIE